MAPSIPASPLVVPPDPRLAASLLATERALRWYLEEVSVAKSPPVSEADARALKDALGGRRPWAAGQFDHLVTFAQAMFRLAPMDASIPACNLGDCLTALNHIELTGAPDRQPWRFDPQVDPAVFAKLEFRETSLGIAKAQRENREGWWAHAQKNRSFIEDAAAKVERRGVVLVLGAGQPFDLPLAALARRFARLVLIDIDAEALAQTAAVLAQESDKPGAAGAGASAGSPAVVETRAIDLTGVNGQLVARIEAIVADAADGAAAAASLMALARSYRLPGLPLLPILPTLYTEPGRADLLVSSCVVTQLAWPQRVFAERLFEARFGPMGDALEATWSAAWTELGLRVQQDHLNALGEAAETVVLTSDVTSHQTVWDARSGSEKPHGRKLFPLGVESLLERIPRFYRGSDHARWKWSRYRANRKGTEGSTMDVEGLVLGEPRSAGGLWVPG